MTEENLNSAEKPKRKFWKFALAFIIILILAFAIYPLTRWAYYSYVANRAIFDYQNWEKAYYEDLKNDTFGGKTPQETYEMFIDTLKKGDILSAAKFYMRDEDRISAYKRFKKMQDERKLEEWVNDRPKWSDMREISYWYKKGKEFQYDYAQKEDYTFYNINSNETTTIPAGKYKARIIFHQSDVSGLWKIYEL